MRAGPGAVSARHNERRELTKEKENENVHQRNAQGGCANAELDLGFASGLGLGVPLNDVLDLDFLGPTFIERSLLV